MRKWLRIQGQIRNIPGGGLFHCGGRALEGGGGRLGGVPGDVGELPEFGAYARQRPDDERPDGSKKDADGIHQLSQEKAHGQKAS